MNRWIAFAGQAFVYQRGRVAAAALLLFIAAAMGLGEEYSDGVALGRSEHGLLRIVAAPGVAIRQFLFDQYQRALPRQRQAQTVAIVGIDEKSLKEVGQWPWPRDRLADLIDALQALKPLAIGLDIYMPEADQTSPEQMAARLAGASPILADGLRTLPGHDARLARSLAAAPSVLGAAGFGFETLSTSAGMRTRPVLVRGGDAQPFLRHFPFVLASLPELQAAARGQALVSVDEAAVIRRIPLVATLGEVVVPSLALEMLRVASDSSAIELFIGAQGVQHVQVADLSVRPQPRGDLWLHFAPEAQGATHRNLSAVDVLSRRVNPEAVADKLVLIGLTGSGLNDRRVTPLGESVAGIEIQAQLIESMLDGRFLLRPWWMKWAELLLLLAIGALMIARVPDALRRQAGGRAGSRRVGWMVTGLCLMLVAAGFGLFQFTGLLFDGASLSVGYAALLASLVSSTTLEVERENRRLAQERQALREQAARLAGEMEAARRIQMGSLPEATRVFPGETRFAIDARIEPAREVGGDLYDFFLIDQRRLCFLIGDVSGKGVPASLFMAVTKALSRSFATRLAGGPGDIVSAANHDLARENVETLFVTLLLGVLDVETGELQLVNAGHDGPWCLGADGALRQLTPDDAHGGPPLCVLDDFAYPVQRAQLRPGDRLCMVTDGITEAMDAAGTLFGSERLRAALASLPVDAGAQAVGGGVRQAVDAFVRDAEPSDDLAILVVQWNGPPRA